MHYMTPDFWQRITQHATEVVAERGLLILVIFALYWLARKIAFRVIDVTLNRLIQRQVDAGGSIERAARVRTLQALSRSITRYVLGFVLIIMVLDALGANVAGIVTTAGIGGVAIGFGAQRLVRDVISGFFLIVEDQFAVGDYVTIGTVTGTVLDLGMRVTRIRDDQGRLAILSNGDIVSVINHSRAPSSILIDIGVAPTTDLETAKASINAVGQELHESENVSLLAPPRCVGVSAYDATRMTISVRVSAEPKVLHEMQMVVREAILQRLLADDIAVA